MKSLTAAGKHAGSKKVIWETINKLAAITVAVFALGCQSLEDFSVNISHYDPAQAYNGYTFFQMNYYYPGLFCVDMDGQVKWQADGAVGLRGQLLGLDLTDDGYILDNYGGYPTIIDPSDNSIVWEYKEKQMHHSIIMPPSKQSVMFISERYPIYTFENPTAPGTYCRINVDKIVEVSIDDKSIIWEWALVDHVDPYVEYEGNPCDVLWSHANTVKFYENYEFNGNVYNAVLFNARDLETFYMIEYPAGNILWSCGQHGTFGRGNPGEPLFGQAHETELLANGNILLFANGRTSPVNESKAMEFEIIPEAGYVQEVWSWSEPFYDSWGGDADRLPNGNTLITNVLQGRIIEVNPNGDKVWEMAVRSDRNPTIQTSYTIYKFKRVTELLRIPE